jgi:CheY-like chemotaxis protein
MDDKEILEDTFKEIDPSVGIRFISTGKEIISLLESTKEGEEPSLIVLDYNMPELDGAEILEKLKSIRLVERVPKLIWSTSGASFYKNKCLQMGATGYLVKPSSVDELEEMIRYMLSFCRDQALDE